MPDVGLEVSEEDAEKASEKRAEAISAFNESSYENAAKLYTEAIGFNPGIYENIKNIIYHGMVHELISKKKDCYSIIIRHFISIFFVLLLNTLMK